MKLTRSFTLFSFIFVRNLKAFRPHSQQQNRIFYQLSKKNRLKPHFHKNTLLPKRILHSKIMSAEIESITLPLQVAVKEQGDFVRKLKESKAPDNEIKKAVAELKSRRKILEDKILELTKDDFQIDRVKLEDLLKQRFFYDASFSIYGGISGLYDFGPMGCAMKSNLLQLWRNHFVLEEHMLEVDCSILTPEYVLKASGHAERFADFMVKDVKSGECFRADHFIKAHFEALLSNKKTSNDLKSVIRDIIPKVEAMSKSEMHELIVKYEMKSPTTNNAVTEPIEFNLMFGTSIGPGGNVKGFLRPETAQGIFLNFKRLLGFNQGRLPFAAAQIGVAFRNEISPRSGLIRVREFTMGEIEHFCDPEDKSHPKFESVKDTEILLYTACAQMDGKLPSLYTLEKAVSEGIIANETLAYFIARIFSFLVKVGVHPKRLRFRQHMANEMAHYAKDCWDAECKTSYGWVECVGCADRSCFDLNKHSIASNVNLTAERKLPKPVEKEQIKLVPNKTGIGKLFKADSKLIMAELTSLSNQQVIQAESELSSNGSYSISVDGKDFTIEKDLLEVKRYTETVHVEEVLPSVIEPSFGIGRIMYVIFEHNFSQRENDEKRTFLSLPTLIAPYKCSILPLSSTAEFKPIVSQLSEDLTKADVSHRVDSSAGSIGRRYARTDQIAIPFGITVDFDTINQTPHTATLRERDTMKQIRAPLKDLPEIVRELSLGKRTWDNVLESYPIFEQQETIK